MKTPPMLMPFLLFTVAPQHLLCPALVLNTSVRSTGSILMEVLSLLLDPGKAGRKWRKLP